MKEKLDVKLDTDQITQTRSKRSTISFRDSAIDKLTKNNTTFAIFSHRFISKNLKDEFVAR